MGTTKRGHKPNGERHSLSRGENPTRGHEERALGHTIRGWRTGVGQTLAQLAEATDLSIGYLSQIERGLANPSLSVLKRLAVSTNHSLGELLEPIAPQERAAAQVTRRDPRTEAHVPHQTYRLQTLSPDLRGELEVMLVVAAPEATSGTRFHDHDSDQCTVVIEGTVDYFAGDDEHTLTEGDAIYLRAGVPHRWVNKGPGRARLLNTRIMPAV